jgi:glycine dehydrogenase
LLPSQTPSTLSPEGPAAIARSAATPAPTEAPVTHLSEFVARHVGPRSGDIQAMLAALGYDSLADLMTATVPESIRLTQGLNLMRAIAKQNQVWRSYLGLGYPTPSPPP